MTIKVKYEQNKVYKSVYKSTTYVVVLARKIIDEDTVGKNKYSGFGFHLFIVYIVQCIIY